MESEELKLLRQNNAMLKEIIKWIVSHNNTNDMKSFMIDVMANIVANRRCV